VKAIAPAFEAAGEGVAFSLGQTRVAALPEGALWLAQTGTLIVSDLHLEKGTAAARSGHLLPPYDTRTTLLRISTLISNLSPKAVISLGDSFHDRTGAERLDKDDLALLGTLIKAVDWIWIQGNHDPAPPRALGGRSAEIIEVEGLQFRHEPVVGEAPNEIAGHLHPCARVVASSGSVRRRCFATDGARMVMPAFGAYAGGLNVCDEAFSEIFPRGCFALMLGRSRVYPAGPSRLVGDC
jgi:DNA ligase-associated metallophosphoesterase